MTQPTFARRLFASLAAALIAAAVACTAVVLAVYLIVIFAGVSATFVSIVHDFVFSWPCAPIGGRLGFASSLRARRIALRLCERR